MGLFDLYIFDLDGTLYRGDAALPGAVEAVSRLKSRGAQIRYLTNNSGQTRDFYRAKLSDMGYPVESSDIYSSATGTATYCASQSIAKLFVVGEPGLVATLRGQQLSVVNAGDDGKVGPQSSVDAEALVAGIHKGFNYEIMSAAMQHVLRGARFIATNADATYPLEQGMLIPGAGSIVASLATCTGQEPFVVGKPNPYLIDLVMQDAGVDARSTLVVGDRYETDIESGMRAGCETFLVLTGVSKEASSNQAHGKDLRALLD
jgi:4-nitrophenyl phosphatase